MPTTKTKPPKLSTFQRDLSDFAVSRSGYAWRNPPDPKSTGAAALNAAITRYAVDPFSRPATLRRGCSHAQPGTPGILFLDAEHPAVLCVGCLIAWPPAMSEADRDICRVCGTASKRFAEHLLLLADQDLTVSVNCCPLCEHDLSA